MFRGRYAGFNTRHVHICEVSRSPLSHSLNPSFPPALRVSLWHCSAYSLSYRASVYNPNRLPPLYVCPRVSVQHIHSYRASICNTDRISRLRAARIVIMPRFVEPMLLLHMVTSATGRHLRSASSTLTQGQLPEALIQEKSPLEELLTPSDVGDIAHSVNIAEDLCRKIHPDDFIVAKEISISQALSEAKQKLLAKFEDDPRADELWQTVSRLEVDSKGEAFDASAKSVLAQLNELLPGDELVKATTSALTGQWQGLNDKPVMVSSMVEMESGARSIIEKVKEYPAEVLMIPVETLYMLYFSELGVLSGFNEAAAPAPIVPYFWPAVRTIVAVASIAVAKHIFYTSRNILGQDIDSQASDLEAHLISAPSPPSKNVPGIILSVLAYLLTNVAVLDVYFASERLKQQGWFHSYYALLYKQEHIKSNKEGVKKCITTFEKGNVQIPPDADLHEVIRKNPICDRDDASKCITNDSECLVDLPASGPVAFEGLVTHCGAGTDIVPGGNQPFAMNWEVQGNIKELKNIPDGSFGTNEYFGRQFSDGEGADDRNILVRTRLAIWKDQIIPDDDQISRFGFVCTLQEIWDWVDGRSGRTLTGNYNLVKTSDKGSEAQDSVRDLLADDAEQLVPLANKALDEMEGELIDMQIVGLHLEMLAGAGYVPFAQLSGRYPWHTPVVFYLRMPNGDIHRLFLQDPTSSEHDSIMEKATGTKHNRYWPRYVRVITPAVKVGDQVDDAATYKQAVAEFAMEAKLEWNEIVVIRSFEDIVEEMQINGNDVTINRTPEGATIMAGEEGISMNRISAKQILTHSMSVGPPVYDIGINNCQEQGSGTVMSVGIAAMSSPSQAVTYKNGVENARLNLQEDRKGFAMLGAGVPTGLVNPEATSSAVPHDATKAMNLMYGTDVSCGSVFGPGTDCAPAQPLPSSTSPVTYAGEAVAAGVAAGVLWRSFKLLRKAVSGNNRSAPVQQHS